MFSLPIERDDRVVAAFPFRDKVVVISESGKVFELRVDEDIGGFVAHLTST